MHLVARELSVASTDADARREFRLLRKQVRACRRQAVAVSNEALLQAGGVQIDAAAIFVDVLAAALAQHCRRLLEIHRFRRRQRWKGHQKNQQAEPDRTHGFTAHEEGPVVKSSYPSSLPVCCAAK